MGNGDGAIRAPICPRGIGVTRQGDGLAVAQADRAVRAQCGPGDLKVRAGLGLPRLGLARVSGAQGEADGLRARGDGHANGPSALRDYQRPANGAVSHINGDALGKLRVRGVGALHRMD